MQSRTAPRHPEHVRPARSGRRRFAGGLGLLTVVLLVAATLVVPISGGYPSRSDSTILTQPSIASPIYSFVATPNPGEVDVPSQLTVTMLGNITTGDTFSYSGLPAGCISSSISVLPCTPAAAGTYTVIVSVSSLLGLVQGNLTWTVTAALAATVAATASSSPLGVSFTGTVHGGVSLGTILWHFGDGTSATGSLSVSHTYSAPGTYEATLQVVDALAVAATGFGNVTLSAPVGTLVAVGIETSASGPAPLTVTFLGSASGGTSPYAFSWAFGDGTTGNGPTPSHTYSGQGDFVAVLTVTDMTSVQAQASVFVVVLPPPGTLVASITASVTAGTAPLSVSFHGSARGGTSPYLYLWTFGDGSASVSGNSTSHTYITPGSFVASLLVTDTLGATSSARVGIVTTSPSGILVASASAIVTAGVAPFLGSFEAMAAGGAAPYVFSWSFGDGGATASGNLATHLYVGPGTYLATLTVVDAHGNVATAHTQVAVTSSVAGTLSAKASSSVTNGVAPLTVDFAGSTQGGVGPYVYLWSFGDGSASTQANPSFVYTTVGSFTASLVVTDATGTTALSFVNVQVFAAGNGLSVGAGDLVTSVSNTSEIVAFTAQASGGTAPYFYAWSFGDGSTASSATTPTHAFSSSGDFSVAVVVSDARGASATYNLDLVVVLSGLLVISSGAPSPGSTNLSWNFEAAAAGGGGPYTYSWNFGDGGPSAVGAAPAHSYSKPGTYLVVVTATDTQGHSSLHDMVINVLPSSPSPATAGLSALGVIGAAVVLGVLVGLLGFRRRHTMTRARDRSGPMGPGEGSAGEILSYPSEELPGEKDVLNDMF